MKSIMLLLATGALMTTAALAQETETPLPQFNRIVASSRVNVILQKGSSESVRILYNNIPSNKVNVKVRGNKLRIYLDHARVIEKRKHVSDYGNTQSVGIYEGHSITAYVTYKDLKGLEMRGQEELRCDDEITADKFKLKVYGESEVNLGALRVTKFKASLYGENMVRLNGTVDRQVYRLFGENKIDARGLKSESASTRIYGEGRLSINASGHVRVNAVGEPVIWVSGTRDVSKGIVLGRADIRLAQ